MIPRYNKITFVFPSIVALVLVAGLVHARALETTIEEGVFLRPDISPYFTTQEIETQSPSVVAVYDSTSIDGINKEPATTSKEEFSSLSGMGGSTSLSFFTNIFLSRFTNLNEEEKSNLFTRLMIRFGLSTK